LLGGTSNRGTVPLAAPPPGPPPSPSSAGSRSSGTWRLLILDTSLRIVASSKRQYVVAMDVACYSSTDHHRSSRLDEARMSATATRFHVYFADISNKHVCQNGTFRICTHDRDILLCPPVTQKLHRLHIGIRATWNVVNEAWNLAKPIYEQYVAKQ
jgi:hypothetical protein